MAKAAASDDGALDRLVRTYSAPLKIFLASAFPRLRSEADEILQDFSTDRLIKEAWLGRADPSRGRFRDFLKASLRNYALDRLRRRTGQPLPILDNEPGPALAASDTPAEEFDLMWARTVLDQTLHRMETDCRDPSADQPRRTHTWEMFRVRLLDPAFFDAPPLPYDQLIARFNLKTPTDASNMLLSAKRMFKGHLQRVIQEYSGADAATAAEIKALSEFLARLAKKG